jgi:hypothetical protein
MNTLQTIPGVTHTSPFHLYDDEKRQPVKCDLLVHPAQGWAVATELADGGPGLLLCPLTLATSICREYKIEPEKLVLFVRYAYGADYENIYALHFVEGGRDLFDTVRFTGASRQLVPLVDMPVLLEALRTGQAATWKPARPAASPVRA